MSIHKFIANAALLCQSRSWIALRRIRRPGHSAVRAPVRTDPSAGTGVGVMTGLDAFRPGRFFILFTSTPS